MIKKILDILFPEKCPVCHRVLPKGAPLGLCHTCRKDLRPLTEPRCKRCSKPVEPMERELCSDCAGRDFQVEAGVALYPYDSTMRQGICHFKYNGELAVGQCFAREMVERYGEWICQCRPDVLIPVPIHKKRRQFRGFNQAEYLAEKIGAELDIPVSMDYLVRTENTKPQKGLDVRERTKNLKKGFAVKDNGRAYETILLVDDIYTTGATLEACGAVLKQAGARRIFFLCLCIGRGD